MRFLKNWKLALLLIPMAMVLSACNSSATPVSEQDQIQRNQDKLTNAVPLPNLDNSIERANISKRLQLFNNPNKVSYIYLVSFGKVMAFYTIKGKVTSSTKRLTSDQKQLGACGNNEYDNCSEIEAPSLDGTYGASDAYIFFWTTDGVYVQWSGEYMEVDQPLKLSTQPELVQTIK